MGEGKGEGEKMKKEAIVLMIILIIWLCGWSNAETLTIKKGVCKRVGFPITVDGKLKEIEWKMAGVLKDFVTTGRCKPAANLTSVRLCYDDVNLYAGFEAKDIDIWSDKAKHDGPLWEGDVVEIYIDPDGDGKNYVEIEVNPLNTVLDLLLPEPWLRPWEETCKWDAEGLLTATRIYGTLNYIFDEDEKWVVELAIPFSNFRELGAKNIPPQKGDKWRVQFYRFDHGKKKGRKFRGDVEASTWSPTKENYYSKEFGEITFK